VASPETFGYTIVYGNTYNETSCSQGVQYLTPAPLGPHRQVVPIGNHTQEKKMGGMEKEVHVCEVHI